MIDKESGIPYYRQLMQIIEQQVASGGLREGQQLPSILEFGSAYRVNRHTVRQAVDELCRQGLLFKLRGRGTFVANHPLDLIEYKLTARNRFSQTIVQAGKMPGSKILQAMELVVPDEVATALNLASDEKVYLLEILRMVNGQPFLLSTNFLPVKHFPGFLNHLRHFSSLFAIYEQHYGIRPQRVKATFRATFPRQPESATLKIPANMPVLKVESLLKSQEGFLIQYTINCYRGDLSKISVEWQESDDVGGVIGQER